MMDDVTIRLRLFAGSWEASAFNEDGQKRKAVCPHYMQAVQELLILLDAQEVKSQPDQYVVPEWVLNCIEQLRFKDGVGTVTAKGTQLGSHFGVVGLSRFFTQTEREEGFGLFSERDGIWFAEYEDDDKVTVDFSGLPLTAENFKENLIKRCQRVGQAIMDAKKPKPIDPDEGLPSWEEVEDMARHLTYDESSEAVYGRYDEYFGTRASCYLTGTTGGQKEGVFCSDGSNRWFFVKPDQDGEEIEFRVVFPHGLKGKDDIGPIILERIRLVRQARAKALQEAASK